MSTRGQLLALDGKRPTSPFSRDGRARRRRLPASDDNNTCMRFRRHSQIFWSGHYPRRRLLLGNPAGSGFRPGPCSHRACLALDMRPMSEGRKTGVEIASAMTSFDAFRRGATLW